MFPNSANATITLFNIKNTYDDIGVVKKVKVEKKNIRCMIKSLTRLDYKSVVEIDNQYSIKAVILAYLFNDQKYATIKDKDYKIERTFINGQFIELYLTEFNLEVDGE